MISPDAARNAVGIIGKFRACSIGKVLVRFEMDAAFVCSVDNERACFFVSIFRQCDLVRALPVPVVSPSPASRSVRCLISLRFCADVRWCAAAGIGSCARVAWLCAGLSSGGSSRTRTWRSSSLTPTWPRC
jgi:hypothetical protein